MSRDAFLDRRFYSREQKKIGGLVGSVRRLRQRCHLMLGKTLHWVERFVFRRAVMVQTPIIGDSWADTNNVFLQSIEDFYVKNCINCLFGGTNSLSIKKTNEHRLLLGFSQSCFKGMWVRWGMPFACSPDRTQTPTSRHPLVDCPNSRGPHIDPARLLSVGILVLYGCFLSRSQKLITILLSRFKKC